MNSKLFNAGIALMATGGVGIVLAIILELQTHEPIYFLLMKITAGLFGIGGPLFGISIARKKKHH